MASSSSTHVVALKPGDILLFPEPQVQRSWDFIQSDPDRESKTNCPRPIYPKDRTQLENWFSFHRLISALDDCSYTHAALVLDPQPDPLLANSDEHDLREMPASEIRWEYPDPILVRRVRRTEFDAERLVTTAKERIKKGKAAQYPYVDMLPVAHLLASRNRPVHIPFLDRAIQRTLRRVSDHMQWDHHVLDQTAGQDVGVRQEYADRLGSQLAFMCAAFVVQVLRLSDLGLKAPLRRATNVPPPDAVAAAKLDWLASQFREIVHAGNKPFADIRAELDATLRFDPQHLRLTGGDSSWKYWEAFGRRKLAHRGPFPDERSRAIPTSTSVLDLLDLAAQEPIEPMFATAYDLEHCEELETVGHYFW